VVTTKQSSIKGFVIAELEVLRQQNFAIFADILFHIVNQQIEF